MNNRFKLAYSKLRYCYNCSGSLSDFLRLVINSKRYSNNKIHRQPDNPIVYQLKPTGLNRRILLRTYSGDIEMFYEVFWRNVYNNSSLNWNTFKVILDVGANIGMTTLILAKQCPNAKIVAVEPDPDNFSLLNINLKPEISNKTVTPVHAAITNNNTEVYLHKTEKSYNSTVSTTGSGMIVRGLNMPFLILEMKIDSIDLLKMDIEGMEEEVFSGDPQWLNIVKNIVLEYHSTETKKKVENLLRSFNFRVTNSDQKGHSGIMWAHSI